MIEQRVLTHEEIAEMKSIRWWHRLPIGVHPDTREMLFTPGEVNHGPEDGKWVETRFGLTRELLGGKSVLDVGGWDGMFSFYADLCGASPVVNADIPTADGGNWGGTKGFEFARRVLGSDVKFSQTNVYDVGKESATAGFDVVLCFGVLYHVRYPQLAVDGLVRATKPGGTVIVETARDPDDSVADKPVWRLIPGKDNDPTNYWYPSEEGLKWSLVLAGFSNPKTIYDDGLRMTITARKPENAVSMSGMR